MECHTVIWLWKESCVKWFTGGPVYYVLRPFRSIYIQKNLIYIYIVYTLVHRPAAPCAQQTIRPFFAHSSPVLQFVLFSLATRNGPKTGHVMNDSSGYTIGLLMPPCPYTSAHYSLACVWIYFSRQSLWKDRNFRWKLGLAITPMNCTQTNVRFAALPCHTCSQLNQGPVRNINVNRLWIAMCIGRPSLYLTTSHTRHGIINTHRPLISNQWP